MIFLTPTTRSKISAAVMSVLMVAVALSAVPATEAEASSPCSTTGATTAYGGGAGTSGDPFLLATAEQLALLSATSADWSKHFKQTANIVMASGCIWSPIASSASFSGTYDGDGFTVSGLKTTNHDALKVGLIGVLDNAGIVKNVGAVGVDFVGKYHVGGLVGESYGTIQNSFATGQIVGKVQTGGLVGSFRGPSISNSYSKTSVSYNSVNPNSNNSVEPYIAGGLVGASIGAPGTISYSWSSGLVATPGAGVNYLIGGVFGGVGASSSAPTFNRVRWDTETSTQSTNAAGAGHVGTTTAQMLNLSTFTGDTYSIVGGWEPFAPTSTPAKIWGICSAVNDGYPFLLWEYTTDPCVAPQSNSGSGSSGGFSAPPQTTVTSSGTNLTVNLNKTRDLLLSGSNLNLVTQASVGGKDATINFVASDSGNLVISKLPLLPSGEYTLTLLTPTGLVQGGVDVDIIARITKLRAIEDSGKLSKQVRFVVRKQNLTYASAGTLRCWGVTTSSSASELALAKQKAEAACAYAKTRMPELDVVSSSRTGTGQPARNQAVKLRYVK